MSFPKFVNCDWTPFFKLWLNSSLLFRPALIILLAALDTPEVLRFELAVVNCWAKDDAVAPACSVLLILLFNEVALLVCNASAEFILVIMACLSFYSLYLKIIASDRR